VRICARIYLSYMLVCVGNGLQEFVYVCMYVCLFVCMYACMHACMHVYVYACMHVCKFVSIFVCVYVYTYVSMYALFIYVHTCFCVFDMMCRELRVQGVVRVRCMYV